jgi:hypothetical protein
MAKDLAGPNNAAWARMYRVVHGWPMLGGIPVPLFLVLMLVGIVGIFAASMFSGVTAAGIVVVADGAVWIGLAWLFRQDQVSVPLFFVQRRMRERAVMSSYCPSWATIVVKEDR